MMAIKKKIILALICLVNSSVFAGMNLVVPIDLVDYGDRSGTSAINRIIRQISLNPADYDGSPAFYFVIVATNADSSNRNIYLRSGTTDYATVTVPANTSVETRFTPVQITPASGNNKYFLSFDGTTSTDQLRCFMARIIVVQTNATITRIQIPLMGRDGSAAGGVTDTTTSISYTQSDSTRYSLFKKQESLLATISSWSFEATLRSATSGYTAYAALFNATDNQQVSSDLSVTGTSTALVSTSISNTATYFDDLDEFEVRIKTSHETVEARIGTVYLYVYLTNLTKFEVFYRVARQCDAKTSADTFEECRAKIDINSFTNPTCYFEATGYCADNAEIFYLQDDGTNDSGTNGSKVTNSGLNFNSASKARLRTASAMTLTDGNRYWGKKDASTNSGQWTNACIVIQCSTPPPSAAKPGQIIIW